MEYVVGISIYWSQEILVKEIFEKAREPSKPVNKNSYPDKRYLSISDPRNISSHRIFVLLR